MEYQDNTTEYLPRIEIEVEEEEEAEEGEMKPVDDRDLRLTIRARNDDGTANGSSCSSRRRRLDERINSGGDLRSRLGARRGSGGRRRGSGDDSLEREHLDADLRAELNSKKRGMQIEVRGDGKRRGKVTMTTCIFLFLIS